jgi:AraC family transcriptional regulator
MLPRIEEKKETSLLGKSRKMSFTNNQTASLWQSFMPNRKLIKNAIGTDLYSLQLYPVGFFESIDPEAAFVKWAAIEVADFNEVPTGMETFFLSPGLYAVFPYKGAVSDAGEIFRYIFGTWLPSSRYLLDDRPHFEILGERFNKDSADSEEEIWIPVRKKLDEHT